MKSNVLSPECLKRAKQLSNEEIECLLLRMHGMSVRQLEDKKLSATEAFALQLEYEDATLEEWRERMAEMRNIEEIGRKVEASVANSEINPS